MSTSTTSTTTTDTATNESANRFESTTSGVKCATTAKGYLQPEFTVRYANADEALARSVADLFKLYDQFATEAADRGLRLVTEQA